MHLLRGLKPESTILEAGCSGGALLDNLQKCGFRNIYGIDLSEPAVAASHLKGLQVQHMDATATTFEKNQFDMIIASDVLEHLEADEKALTEWYRILKKNGQVVIFVPAFQMLWSGHDVKNQHFRRYTRNDLKRKVTAAGFTIQRASYWNGMLFFPTVIWRLMRRIIGLGGRSDDLHALPAIVNIAILSWMRLENTALRYVNFPVGVSAWVVAKK